MKVHLSPEPEFRPVILTLESQAEVNGIFALLNHSLLRPAAGLPPNVGAPLAPYAGYEYDTLHTNLCNLLRK